MCQARSCFASHFSLTVEGSLGVIGGRATASLPSGGREREEKKMARRLAGQTLLVFLAIS